MFSPGGGNGSGVGRSSSNYRELQRHHVILPATAPSPPLLRHHLPNSLLLGGGSYDEELELPPRIDERVPQWSNQETLDFIAIRAHLENDFTLTKRNKTLWEAVSAHMKERGYRRTPDQCKCKWKNLVNRYKGKETSDADSSKPCPFFDELHAIFLARENKMKQSLVESESGSTRLRKRSRKGSEEQSSEEFIEFEEYNEETDEVEIPKGGIAARRKAEKGKRAPTAAPQKSSRRTSAENRTNTNSNLDDIQNLLVNFFEQQQRIEIEWMQSMDKRAQERELFEQEWRQSMEKLERERLMMEHTWREKEEQRRIREESRAEKRDALLTTLLNKLLHDKTT